ncbi:MAG TPA: IS21 family transposase [Thermoleophilia bacterium]|nr:IS21 family transposase [Thermoleophilia bacterium]
MTVSLEVAAEIRRLYFAEHWKRGTIATQLGVHFDVVKRVLGRFGPQPGTARPASALLDPYVAFIDETLEQYPRLVATRLFDMIRARGYAGSLRSLRRHVRKVRPRPRRAYLDIETLAGEVAEVDWAHVGEIAVPGGHRPLWMFVLLLSYSRAVFAELVLSLDASSLRRSLLRAAAHFGGCPRAWLFDNAKTVVVERRGNLVRYHRDLVELAAELHVELRVCDPGAPHQKGGVERTIRYLKGRFFAARHIHSVAQGNAQLLEFLDDIAHERPHPRLVGRTVAEVLEEERARLLPLPASLPSIEEVRPVAVDSKAFVQLDSNRYSVPTTHASGTLSMVTSDSVVRLLDGENEVARHERCWGRKQVIERHEHRAELRAQKRGARDLKGRDRLCVEVPAIEVILERWLDREHNLGSMVARTLKLLDSYGPAVLGAAVDEMLKRHILDIGAMAVLCETHCRRRGSRVVPVLDLAPHVPECDVVPHDLGGYDD